MKAIGIFNGRARINDYVKSLQQQPVAPIPHTEMEIIRERAETAANRYEIALSLIGKTEWPGLVAKGRMLEREYETQLTKLAEYADQVMSLQKQGAIMETVLVPVELIDPNPYQPRKSEDPAAIADLADSIARNGMLQVPTARCVNERYQLAFGHTRLAAHKLLQTPTMKLTIQDLTDLQMFEMGVAENVKRRDLNPIEEAEAMKRYMDDFGKTSVEAGEFFAVSEETVRGKIRLLNLPTVARQKLAEGVITVSAARSLLTMARIAPEKVVAKTVDDIEKSLGTRSAEDIIEGAFRYKMNDAVNMHSNNSDGKPRAGRGGWLLDMKNFPNKLLPSLTPVDVALALEIQDDQEMIEKAMHLIRWMRGEPDMSEAEYAELKIPDDLVAKIKHLMAPPACTACPFYAKVQGSHFCGMKICHTRKSAAWQDQSLIHASKALKIEVYDELEDGPYKLLEYSHQSLFDKRAKGLRLIATRDLKGYAHQWSFKGVDDDIFAVVATGEAREKVAASSQPGRSTGKKTTAELVKMRQLKVYRPRRRQLIWEFAREMKHLFDGLTYPMLKDIDRKMGYLQQDLEPSKEVMVAENAKVDAEKADYYRCKIIWRLAVENAWGEINNVTKFDDILKRLERLAKEWGVKMPKKLATMAGQFQLEVDDIAELVKAKKADEKMKGKKK